MLRIEDVSMTKTMTVNFTCYLIDIDNTTSTSCWQSLLDVNIFNIYSTCVYQPSETPARWSSSEAFGRLGNNTWAARLSHQLLLRRLRRKRSFLKAVATLEKLLSATSTYE